MQCEETEKYLFEFTEGGLTDLERKAVDQHLQQCAECSRLLNDIWETALQGANWQDVPVPRWEKRTLFFGHGRAGPGGWPWLNLVSVAASALVLVAVLVKVEVMTSDDGFAISFSGQNDLVSEEELAQRLTSVQRETERSFNANVDRLTSQQVTTNQLLLRSILETSRQERREDLGNMMVLWDSDRQRRNEMTEESLRFLIRNQAEDKRELRDITQTLRSIDNLQDNNL